MPGGRKSLYQELQIKERLAALTPKAFKFIQECLDGDDKADKRWASEQWGKLAQKAIPQNMDVTSGGEPIPILGTYVQSNNGNNQDNKDVQADTSSVGGDVSEQDGINNLIPDPPCTDGQNTNAN